MSSNSEWSMPSPSIGDIVVFSKDYRHFTDPTVGFVVGQPGDSTISILTFTNSGYAMVHTSCHHKDDPALTGDHGWQDLGVWDFAPATKVLRELTQASVTSARKTAK